MTEYILHHHPAASIFPMHSEEEYKSLIDDIAENGLLEAIWIHKGQIIDGRNRNKACMELGIPAQYREYEGDNIASFVVSLNVKRRHLNKSQLAMIALDLEKIFASEAKERQGARNDLNINQRIDECKPQAAEQAAKALGTNRQYVSDAKKIRKTAPDLEQKVVSGEMTLPRAINETRKRETIASLKEIEEGPVQPLIGVYDVIVIDPPWPMQKIQREVRPNQVTLEYPTMNIEDIQEICLPTADSCHIWLWSTQKQLPNAFRCIESWGLKYVCTFVWHKPGGIQPLGLPQYNAEFALYARKGTPIFLDAKAFPVCFNAPRGRHSEKPEEFYNLLRRVTGGRRLDMFNRRKIEGFDGWGNESVAA